MKKEIISLYSYIPIRFADPISALGISSKNIVIGTMMGRINSLSINDKKLTLLKDLSQENISGVSFIENKNIFNVSIGDDEILQFEIDSPSSNSIPRIKNYKNEFSHSKKCENMFSLLSKNSLMLIELAPQEEGNITISDYDAFVQITHLDDEDKDNFEIPMTNYSIPLDFDGYFFVYVEFLSDKKRNLCVKNMIDLNEEILKLNLDEKFGHISHCKIIPGFKLVLVRNLNKCEIREINKQFTLIKSFTSIGDEVIAIDFFDKNKSVSLEGNEDESRNHLNEKKIDLPNNHTLKIKVEKNIVSTSSNNVRESNNLIIKDYNIKTDIIIGILDIDGNVNFYENDKVTKKFNLYDIKEINEDQRKKQFFSMGYAYYIKFNKNYICISTDHGCYVIKINYK